MENNIYTITLEDGTVISDLRLNGNNFISSKKLTEDIFEDNLTSVTISDGTHEEHHEHMQLVQITQEEKGEYWFVLIDIPQSQLDLMQIRANIDYLAMMTDVDL